MNFRASSTCTHPPRSAGRRLAAARPETVTAGLLVGLTLPHREYPPISIFFTFGAGPSSSSACWGLFVIAACAPILNRRPLFCLLAPRLGFGTLDGPWHLLVLTTAQPAWVLASFIPFFSSATYCCNRCRRRRNKFRRDSDVSRLIQHKAAERFDLSRSWPALLTIIFSVIFSLPVVVFSRTADAHVRSHSGQGRARAPPIVSPEPLHLDGHQRWPTSSAGAGGDRFLIG